MSDFVFMIKQAAVEAVETSKPVKVAFGTVISSSPLKIQNEQHLILDSASLILTNAVKDHYVDMTVDHITQNTSGGGGDSAFASHNHQYVGRKSFLIHNGLVVGDKVVMVAMQGGQKYVVIDRI